MEYRDLFKDIVSRWLYILAGIVVGAALAYILTVTLPKIYRAEMTIGPASEKSASGLSLFLPGSNIPQLDNFFQKLSGTTSNNFLTFENTIKTSKVAQALKNDLTIMRALFLDEAEQKSYADLRDYLKKEVTVAHTGSGSLRRIVYYHTDPAFASLMLERLYATTDQILRQEAQDTTEKRLTYLEAQLKQARHPDHRDALMTLMKDQEHAKMMASIDVPFAAILIEPPVVSSLPVSPNPKILFPTLILLGGLLGYGIGSLRGQNGS